MLTAMQLLVIRHAIAEDRAEFARTGGDDDVRPVTKEGRRKMKRNAAGLATLVPKLDLLATSPLLRAVQTAEIVAKRVRVAELEVRTELVPEEIPSATLEWLRSRKDAGKVVAIVGPQPHLGRLVGWLISGRDREPLELRKGGACLVDLPRAARPGQGVLLWALTPSQLRALAR